DLLQSPDWEEAKAQAKIPLALGKDVYGKAIITDLAQMPHLADPQDVAVAQRLLRKAQHRGQSSACHECEEQPPENAPPGIFVHACRAPGIGNDDREGPEADRETGDLEPDGVGDIGE